MRRLNDAESMLEQIWKDYQLGKLIREKGISVMRIEDQPGEWSACNASIDEMMGHNGQWTNGNTPLEAVQAIK